MESIRFQVKCDAATILGFAAREKNGARYETFFYCRPTSGKILRLILMRSNPLRMPKTITAISI
jgi:hypothetical protein